MTSEDKLKDCVFFVEANSYEQFALWKENHSKKRLKWEEDNSGFSIIVGNIGKGKPVNVAFNFAKIRGKRICFYEAISRYVDHDMVEKWIEKNYPVKWDNGNRRAMTDAMNFHHAIDACQNG